MYIATTSKRHSTAIEFRAALAWGFVVLALTLIILVLGAIVLPAQAYETSTHDTLTTRAQPVGTNPQPHPSHF